jgi:hypothetical protein
VITYFARNALIIIKIEIPIKNVHIAETMLGLKTSIKGI